MEMDLEQAKEMAELTDRIRENLNSIYSFENLANINLNTLLEKTDRITENLNIIWRYENR